MECLECCVCLDEKILETTHCGHKICEDCVMLLEKKVCPICRSDIYPFMWDCCRRTFMWNLMIMRMLLSINVINVIVEVFQ
ncbi:MAG: hypothetical protein Hyperionvirus5_92 [Hyperionvirus sp.]|uniref:RING-type domain-containing protein n=1 Tax=Hyperionvirus sp. TaxID=2487770 RepID=A0A3G5A7Q2_9VIRU|nr:MAG: hypothetical protein Hyperionvirus5_92 [Hyperionvirus sp.]